MLIFFKRRQVLYSRIASINKIHIFQSDGDVYLHVLISYCARARGIGVAEDAHLERSNDLDTVIEGCCSQSGHDVMQAR